MINIVGMGGKVATPIHLPGGAANSALMLATVGLANVYGPKVSASMPSIPVPP